MKRSRSRSFIALTTSSTHCQQIRSTEGTIALEQSTNRPVITRVVAEKDPYGRTIATENGDNYLG
jgi:hypothetical protein